MEDSLVSQIVINNEYDYSNIIPTIELVSYLVKYCDQMNKQLTNLIEKDEEKNKPFKTEYKNFMYKKSYSQELEIFIREKSYNNITCNNYDSFISAVNDGNLNNISSLEIKLCMDFYRGNGDKLEKHENSFTIIFEPYNIIFARKSNYNDLNMDKLEQQIIELFNRFPIANSIFCNKKS